MENKNIFRIITDYIKANPHVWFIMYFPVYLAGYQLVEKLVPSGSSYWVSYMPIDDKIPFVEGFVIAYITWYLVMFAAAFFLYLKDRKELVRYMLFVIIGLSACLIFFLILPNGQDLRPDPLPRDNIFTRIISIIYAADTNTNVLPSMHVVGSGAVVCAAIKSKPLRRYFWWALIINVIITASTVLIKQHSMLDIITGIGFSVLLYLCIYVIPDHIAARKEKAAGEEGNGGFAEHGEL